jgi:hypothetical protein
MRLAADEYNRFLDLLRSLHSDDWAKPTRCAPWDVREMAAHLLGMVELAASIREQNRQTKAAAGLREHRGGLFIDALTGLQVDERADWTPQQIIDRFEIRAPKAAKGRKRAPGFIRRKKVPELQDVDGHKDLHLSGPAGGHWTTGTDGPTITMDAIEFCRAISGRAAAEGLLTTQVPF